MPNARLQRTRDVYTVGLTEKTALGWLEFWHKGQSAGQRVKNGIVLPREAVTPNPDVKGPAHDVKAKG